MSGRPAWSTEAAIVDAFAAWLERDGWTVEREIDYVDVIARRCGETLYAEAKGATSEPGIDADVMYGQLLRRMNTSEGMYAVVVPEGRSLTAALRVPAWVRHRLNVTVYVVDESGTVRAVTA